MKPNCWGRSDEFIDYEDGDPDIDTEGLSFPDKELAAILCEGCPFFAQCREDSLKFRPVKGIWAGKIWIEGVNGKGVILSD